MAAESNAWWDVVADIVEQTHSASGPDVGRVADRAVRRLGMTAELYLVDRGQRILTPIASGDRAPVTIEGTLAGRAFQLEEPVWRPARERAAELWVPMVDGTERLGVLCFGLSDELSPEDADLRARCTVLAGLLGHIVATKFAYGDALHVARRARPFTSDAELLWQLLPPLTFASKDLVISVVLEPHQRVGGDAFDYAVNEEAAFCALFDSVGHDMQSGLTTAVALAAIRNARRGGEHDLGELARIADKLIIENRPPGARYVTAVLSWLDIATGELTYVLAGHPPPLLLRANTAVKCLETAPRIPLGVSESPAAATAGREQLEPGDRLLLYTDGIPEARDEEDRLFGIERLVGLIERDSAAALSAPETLRRVMHGVLEYQRGRIQDDATLMMVDWRPPPGTGPQETPHHERTAARR
ncbi:PP2C family protein-serine/threonine phosphatase [Saccharomonospora cyanea]|uniref:Stage II sporulation protein E (SpoIIE) n=1 Tax=Saccharomonospora cyanea NA-134 TaxID=882082 RepID=H5XH91_9PSEU|nr:PP2C family protein-serine/threonine phosphatase [Saccharomonospora cyanea]EHR60576.1 Stage II sporulation protein E (SpoIIE) [Saccharomonospora cyanea NA-134]